MWAYELIVPLIVVRFNALLKQAAIFLFTWIGYENRTEWISEI